MTKPQRDSTTSPVPALIAIVLLSILMLLASVVLIADGYKDMVAPVAGIFLPIITALIGIKIQLVKAQLSSRAINEAAAVKEELVKHDIHVERQIVGLKDTAEATHKLVDGRHGEALKAVASLATRLADLTGKPEDAAMAQAARGALDEHHSKYPIGNNRPEDVS